MSTVLEALEHFYAAINRSDMQAISRDFDPDIVRIEPAGFEQLAGNLLEPVQSKKS